MDDGPQSARKLHNRKGWLILAGLAVAIALFAAAQLILGNKGEHGALAFLGFALYLIWVGRWRPMCPKCGAAKAQFYVAEGYNERLGCPSCGFDEPTGFKCYPPGDTFD
jgi:rubredoxin